MLPVISSKIKQVLTFSLFISGSPLRKCKQCKTGWMTVSNLEKHKKEYHETPNINKANTAREGPPKEASENNKKAMVEQNIDYKIRCEDCDFNMGDKKEFTHHLNSVHEGKLQKL